MTKPKQASAPAKPAAEVKVERATATPKPPSKPRLIVSSWSGAYGQAQKEAIIAPVSRDLGIDIKRRARSSASDAENNVDVTELDQADLMAACRSGRVIKIRRAKNLNDDYIAGSLSDCGVPTFAWSSMLVANSSLMKKLAKRRYREPNKLQHLIDTKKYPGKRALIRSPKRLLEMMLLANGVARNAIYTELATRAGQDKAFKLLDDLRTHIQWVDGPRGALEALDRGEVTIAMTYSGRAFRRLVASTLQPIWDGHIIDFASWAIPASSTNRENAERFIQAATRPENLAAQARIWPYGPMRRSALQLAKRHALLDTDLAAFMPTSAIRFDQGLLLNATFWSEHGSKLEDRFQAWLSGVPLGIRVPLPHKAPPPPLPPPPVKSTLPQQTPVQQQG